MELRGKRALITGGGFGIGRGILERFIEEGAEVTVVGRRPLDSELAAHEAVHQVQADLTDPEAASAVVESAVARFGQLDVLVNNAGVMLERNLGEITVDEWDVLMSVNLRAPMLLAQAALPHLIESSAASIINIGSIESIGSKPGHFAYAASKAGLHGLTRALAVELGVHGIRVNAIAPGWTRSALSEALMDSMPDPAEARRRVDGLHPIGRMGEPRDIADLAVFLASDRCSFMTGESIVVDGGRTIRLTSPG